MWMSACLHGLVSVCQRNAATLPCHVSHNLNSLKGGYIGDYVWEYYRGY